jgi:hypothetical protein
MTRREWVEWLAFALGLLGVVTLLFLFLTAGRLRPSADDPRPTLTETLP